MNEQARVPKKKSGDTTIPREGVSAQESEGGFQISPDSASPSVNDGTVAGSSSLPVKTPIIYFPECGLLMSPY